MDSLTIIRCGNSHFKIITNVSTLIRYFFVEFHPGCSISKTGKICWQVKEQLNFVAGVLHNAIFLPGFVKKRWHFVFFSVSEKNSDDRFNLHSHAIYLTETSIHFFQLHPVFYSLTILICFHYTCSFNEGPSYDFTRT